MTPDARKLAEDNHRLIYHFLLKHSLPLDEYYGAAATGLCRAAETYDPSKGAFSTYAYRGMLNATGDEMRRHRRWGREVSLDTPLTEGAKLTLGDTLSAPDNLEETAEAADAVGRIMTAICQLTDRDAQIVRMRIVGAAQAQIAVLLGMSQPYVSRRLARIRAKIAAL